MLSSSLGLGRRKSHRPEASPDGATLGTSGSASGGGDTGGERQRAGTELQLMEVELEEGGR